MFVVMFVLMANVWSFLALFSLLFLLSLPGALGFKESDVDWESCGEFSAELLWGSSVNLSCGGVEYLLSVRDFSVEGEFVVLDVLRNGSLLTSGFMRCNESFYYDGGVDGAPLKVVVSGINGEYQEEEPTYSVNLSVFTLGKPNLTFSQNTSIGVGCVYNTSIVVKNTGTARLKDVVVSYGLSDELCVTRTSADRPFSLPTYGGYFTKRVPRDGELGCGESLETSFEVVPPALSVTQHYPVNVTVVGYDILGRRYEESFTYEISVPRNLSASKTVTIRRPYADSSYIGTVSITTLTESEDASESSVKENDYPVSVREKMRENALPYVGDQLIVSLTIFNTGCNDIEEVHVGEIIPDGFIIDPYKETNWSVALNAKRSASFNYTIRPLHPGEYSLPSTVIEMIYNGETYTTRIDMSDAKKLVFHGPEIRVMKNVTPEVATVGDDVTVTLTIENLGDRSAKVETYDKLPRGSTIKRGKMTLEGVLHPKGGSNEPTILTTTYTFKINRPGEIRLPAARVELTDITHYNATVYSNRPLLTVQEDRPETEKTTTIPRERPSYEDRTSNQSSEDSTQPNPGTPGFGILTTLFTLATLYIYHRRVYHRRATFTR